MAAVVKGFLLLENPYEDVYVETLRAIFRKKIDLGSELVLTCNSDKFFQLLDFIKLDVDTRDLHAVISSLMSQWVNHINMNDCELL